MSAQKGALSCLFAHLPPPPLFKKITDGDENGLSRVRLVEGGKRPLAVGASAHVAACQVSCLVFVFSFAILTGVQESFRFADALRNLMNRVGPARFMGNQSVWAKGSQKT